LLDYKIYSLNCFKQDQKLATTPDKASEYQGNAYKHEISQSQPNKQAEHCEG